MENLSNKHKFHFSFFSFIAAIPFLIAVLIWSCGGGDGTSTAERLKQDQLNEVKESVLAEINNLKNEVEQRIEFLEDEAGTADNQVRARMDEYRNELIEQNELLSKEYQNIQDATFEEWNDIAEGASETINQVNQKTNEITKEVRDLIDK
jgi:hypothetical protein